MKTQAEQLLESPDEESQVLGWRVETFVEAGCPVTVAETLAISEGDTHKIDDALRAGCSPERAVEIFL